MARCGDSEGSASAHFEEAAGRYEAVARERPEFEERFAIFKRRIGTAWERAGGGSAVAVDLGCGSGELTWYVAAKGFRTFGVDSSAAMLEHARRRAEVHGIDDITFLERHLPLVRPSEIAAPAGVALVVASSVLEYVERDQELLEQCGSLLAADGQALISFPNRRSVYWALQRRLRKTRLFRNSDSYHQRHLYVPAEVGKLGAAAKLAVSDVQYFALPLQRKLPRSWRWRSQWLAMMFVATFSRSPDTPSGRG